LIERKKLRKRKPSRLGHKRSGGMKNFNFQNNSVPRTRVDISKALERYNNLAQDAQSNGDRIVAENFFQYAEHYQRLLNEHPKPDFNHSNNKNSFSNEHKNVEDMKLSRTQRAINAKNERLKQIDPSSEKNPETENEKKKNFTSDGLEALKPFEVSLDSKKSHST
tara:strand:- start:590 stop:1084 length:495 start_codon:yes stop_codon:yes gene_type:complete